MIITKEKELREKIIEALDVEGFKIDETVGLFTMEVKHKNMKEKSFIWLISIYGNKTGFHSNGEFKGIRITSGYGRNKIATKIMFKNSSNIVIKNRIKEFKEKLVIRDKHNIEKIIKKNKK